MNKKLVAVAVAGVLGAPLAAHAQTANVTLYGRLNVDLEVGQSAGQPDGSEPEPCTASQLELVALRRARHRIARWRPERDLPDRVGDQRRHQRRQPRPVAKRSSASKAAGARSRWATS